LPSHPERCSIQWTAWRDAFDPYLLNLLREV